MDEFIIWDVMYTAIVLNKEDRIKLKEALLEKEDFTQYGYQFKTRGNRPLPHHMTINIGKFDDNLNDREILNKQAAVKVDFFVYNHKLNVCAARVIFACSELSNLARIASINDTKSHKHITMCVREDGKPSDSNKLDYVFSESNNNVILLDEILILNGKVEEVT